MKEERRFPTLSVNELRRLWRIASRRGRTKRAEEFRGEIEARGCTPRGDDQETWYAEGRGGAR